MEKIVDYLKQLELSDIEARLYLALLKSGSTGVKELAQAINIKRTTAYIYIDMLVEKELVIKTVKGSRKQVAAIDPEEGLEELVKKRIKSAEETKVQFADMLKEINSLTPSAQATEEAEIKYYKGKLGVKKIYQDALQSQELRSYVNITEILEAFPENAKLFNNAFKKNPQMIMYEIAEDSPQARERIETSNKMHIYKLLPKNVNITSTDILIYNGKVSIINLKDKIDGIVLNNKDLFNNFKILFDLMWNMLPEYAESIKNG